MFKISHKVMGASGLALALVACDQIGSDPALSDASVSTEAAGERTYFEDLFSTPVASTDAAPSEPVDFAVAFANLPEGISLETGAVSVVAETGATRVEDFAIVYDVEGEGIGLQADEVLFYGFDPDAMADRIRGTNLDASVKVADRIELRGVNSVGMDVVSQMFMDRYLETIDEFTPLEGDLAYQGDVLDSLNYNFGIEAMLIDGFTLEPFTFVKEEAVADMTAEPGGFVPHTEDLVFELESIARDDVDAEMRAGVQYAAAFARAFSVEAIAYKNLNANYEMSMEGVTMGMDMTMPLAGIRGYRRGDLEYSGGWDATFAGSFPVPADPYGEAEMKSVPMTGGIAFTEHSGVRLARAFEALANWEMPASDEADFMDFGSIKMSDYTMDLDGATMFKMKSFAFDTDFHWLLPTQVDFSFTDTGYNMANLFEVMTEELAADLDGEFTAEDLQRGLAITKEYGFDCFCGDLALNFNWDESSGDMAYRERSRFADAFKGTTDVDLGFSTPAKVASLFDMEDPEEAFEEGFKSDFAFQNLMIEMTDIGGLTNLFDMLDAIGDAFPEQDGMAMLTYNDAAQLRLLAVNSVIGMKPMVRQEFEPADPWMTALANFLEEGGSLKVAVSPAEPVTVALIEELEASDSDPEPEEIVDFLGITVTHTK